MATITGRQGAVTIGSPGVDITEVTSWSLDLTRDVIESTVMGDSARSFVPGLVSFSGSFDFMLDADAPTAQTAVDLDSTSELAFTFEAASGDASATYSGNGYVTGKSISAEIEGMVTVSVTFQGTGAITEPTA